MLISLRSFAVEPAAQALRYNAFTTSGLGTRGGGGGTLGGVSTLATCTPACTGRSVHAVKPVHVHVNVNVNVNVCLIRSRIISTSATTDRAFLPRLVPHPSS